MIDQLQEKAQDKVEDEVKEEMIENAAVKLLGNDLGNKVADIINDEMDGEHRTPQQMLEVLQAPPKKEGFAAFMEKLDKLNPLKKQEVQQHVEANPGLDVEKWFASITHGHKESAQPVKKDEDSAVMELFNRIIGNDDKVLNEVPAVSAVKPAQQYEPVKHNCGNVMGKGKAGKKGKKAKKSAEDDGPVPDAIPIEQTRALLAFLTVESRKRSVAFYRSWCNQQLSALLQRLSLVPPFANNSTFEKRRELLKQHRSRLETLGKNEYFTVKKMGAHEKELEASMDVMRHDAALLVALKERQRLTADSGLVGPSGTTTGQSPKTDAKKGAGAHAATVTASATPSGAGTSGSGGKKILTNATDRATRREEEDGIPAQELKAIFGADVSIVLGEEPAAIGINRMKSKDDKSGNSEDRSLLGIQKKQLSELYDVADKLEDEYEACTVKIEDLQDFEMSGGASLLEAEAMKLKKLARQRAQENLQHLEKIQSRHEASLIATAKRRDRILATIEQSAHQQQMSSVKGPHAQIYARNSSLKNKVGLMKAECAALALKVSLLEQENMRLVHQGFDLDWNLMYGDGFDGGKDLKNGAMDGAGLRIALTPDPDTREEERQDFISDDFKDSKRQFHLRIKTVSDAIKSVIQKEADWQQSDLSSFGVIGTKWKRRVPKSAPVTQALSVVSNSNLHRRVLSPDSGRQSQWVSSRCQSTATTGQQLAIASAASSAFTSKDNMGNSVSQQVLSSTAAPVASANSAAIFVSDLSGMEAELQYERSLGSSRFLKTVRCRDRDGAAVVAKVFLKPAPSESDAAMSVAPALAATLKTIQDEAEALANVPNVFVAVSIVETQKAAYMLRQYIYSNLYDRISTRPFLGQGEKIWITFQLLVGLSQAHAMNIFHGDIKSENVLVTTWNWAYLSDFAGYKPTYLPEDNPADFSFFFDSSTRRTCYLAPERFLAPGESLFDYKGVNLTAEMDIFGLGCTIAEMFLEGTPLFSLSQLLRYRRGEYDPTVVLDKIDNIHVKEMLKSMISIQPEKRKSAETYVHEFRDLIFPSFYSTFLHTFIHSLSVSDNFQPLGADEKLVRLHSEFWRVAEAAGFPNTWDKETELKRTLSVEVLERQSSDLGTGAPRLLSGVARMNLLPLNLTIPNFTACTGDVEVKDSCHDVSLILTSIVCASVRNAYNPSSRLMALELLMVLGIQLNDDDRLDRLVPYIVLLLQDDNAVMRATALKVLAQLLSMVESITTADVNIFQEYILPVLKPLEKDTETIVRVTYAGCIANIAETALRFLELSQLFQQNYGDNEGDGILHQLSYDVALNELHDTIQEEVVTFLSDSDVFVKRALLHDMPRLCIFFGRQRANDVLLSHMITYLNDRDWQLRSAFFESIVGVGTFVGSRSLEEYILPLVVLSLTDAEEFVVEKVLNALTLLAELGLFQKFKLKELVGTVMPLLCHPSLWIRHASIAFVAATAKVLPLIDVRCILYPLLRPFLKTNIPDVTDVNLLFHLKSSLSRALYDQALLLAAKEPNEPFKRERQLSDTLELSETKNFSSESTKLIVRLREFGMTDEDKEKLFAMKFYISKTTQRRSAKVTGIEDGDRWLAKKIPIAPHTVFLTPPKYISPASEPFAKSSPRLQLRHSSANLMSRSQSPFNMDSAMPAPLRALRNDSTVSSEGGRSSGTGAPMSPDRVSHLREGVTGSALGGGSLGALSETSSVIAPRYSETDDDGVFVASGASYKGKQVLRGAFSSESIRGGGAAGTYRTSTALGSVAGGVRRSGGSVIGTPPRMTKKLESVLSRDGMQAALSTRTGLPASGIDGHDEHIKLLLEAKRSELFPPPIYDLGAKVFPTSSSMRSRRHHASRSQDGRSWRPKGILAAHLTEHRGAVNQICVSPDDSFFATGSDDGTIKIWDCRRLERNVTNKSRLTYSKQGGHIRSLAFLQNHNVLASTSDNGSIHISRVEYMSASNPSGAARYAGIDAIKVTSTDDDKPALLSHYEADASSSQLVYTTERGKICCLDLRSMKTAWSYQSPAHEGTLTAFTMDPRNSWIVSGSHRGVFSLWDIRFGLRIKSWSHPSGAAVHKLVRSTLASSRRGTSVAGSSASSGQSLSGGTSSSLSSSGSVSSKLVLASVAGATSELGQWDVEQGECQEVWCSFGGASVFQASSGNAGRGVDTHHRDNVADEMNRVYGKGLKSVPPPTSSEFLVPITRKIAVDAVPSPPNATIKAVYAPQDASFILTAGLDRKIRFWDLATIGNSYIISGMEPSDSKPRYSSHPYKDLTFNIEYIPPPPGLPAANSRPSFHTGSSGSFQNQQQVGGGIGSSAETLMASPSIINHLDGINDMVVTQVPYPMIISGGRDGVVKVFT
ncbi:Serine/threonine-protein kinase [Chytriomyces hyalinus]|nr:Serine/threonine-protein kinase [Chytriomyces hyalinus]